MAQWWEFAIHGVDVHVQYGPSDGEYELPDPFAPANSVERTSNGTIIRQDEGANWFHFAITTPMHLGDQGPALYLEASYWGTANEQATVREVQVWGGGVPKQVQLDSKRTAHSGRAFEASTYVAGRYVEGERPDCKAPVVVSLYVEFDEGGEITFGGAGVRLSTGGLYVPEDRRRTEADYAMQ